MDFLGEIVGQELGAGGVAPAPEQDRAECEDVTPIEKKRGTVVDEFRQ